MHASIKIAPSAVRAFAKRCFVGVTVASCFVACAGRVQTIEGLRCPPLRGQAVEDIVRSCGSDLSGCEGFERWLSDLDAVCRGLDV